MTRVDRPTRPTSDLPGAAKIPAAAGASEDRLDYLKVKSWVGHPWGDRLLVVPVRSGSADLEAIACLNARAAALWQGLEDRFSWEDLREAAGDDAAALLSALRERGLVEGPPREASHPAAGSPVPNATPGVTSAAALEASDVESVARAVLDQGHSFRFRARGRSMRPQIPSGSVIEIEAAAAGDVRRGQIAFYATPEQRLVAHRVIRNTGGELRTRGDSAARIDVVTPDRLLGVVVARWDETARGPSRAALDTMGRRLLGTLSGRVYRVAAWFARVLVVIPLARSSRLRGVAAWFCRAGSGVLRFLERRSDGMRRRLDVTRAGLLSTEQKDASRRELYAGRAAVDFTALDENVEAGLTLIEEVLLQRHPLRGSTTLVLGCGPGRECVAIARGGQQVVGLDREEGMLERARELAGREGLSIEFVAAEAMDFDLAPRAFDNVVLFSGLYNMVVPRQRRVQMLRAARRHLVPGGRVLLTFLSDYVPPGSPPPPPTSGMLRAIQPDHEDGDLFLLNEVVHIFPHPELLAREAREAGFDVDEIFRDQRAYDRRARQVRGYAALTLATTEPPGSPPSAP